MYATFSRIFRERLVVAEVGALEEEKQDKLWNFMRNFRKKNPYTRNSLISTLNAGWEPKVIFKL